MNSLEYKMLKRIIERDNPNVSKSQIELSLLDQLSQGNIEQFQYDELYNKLNAEQIEPEVI